MDESEIQEKWIRLTSALPTSGNRCLVTDGDVIVIATYISESNNSIWMFSGLNESDSKNFDVQGWMNLPKPPKKIVSYDAPNVTQDEKSN